MKVIKLRDNANIKEIVPGMSYLGVVIGMNKIKLNKNIVVDVKHNFSKGTNVVFTVKKVVFPDKIIGDVSEMKKQVTRIADIDDSLVDKEVNIVGLVDSVIQTSGPTLFNVVDGSGSMKIKAFAGAGKRAYPNINENDYFNARIKIKKRNDVLEGEIVRISKGGSELKSIIDSEIESKSKPDRSVFTIDLGVYEHMKPLFLAAATEIKKAILENHPIILRHHADCDGYSAAIALEHAILKNIEKYNSDAKSMWTSFERIPNRTPFFDYSDLLKDMSFFLDDMDKFGAKNPVYIILDFGSSNESLLAYQKLKEYGTKIIVVDHHYSSDEEFETIKNTVDIFINPHMHGGDESICAGMLGYELSKFVYSLHHLDYLPALAGFGDRVEGEAFEKYKESQFLHSRSLDFLKKLSKVVDYEAFFVRTFESRRYFQDLLGEDYEKQKRLVDLIYPKIEAAEQSYLKTIEKYAEITKTKHNTLVLLRDIGMRFSYPAVGKICGLAFDHFKEKYENVATLYVMEDGIVFRVSEECGVDLNEKFKEVRNKFPEAQIDGGGHKLVGSLRFVPIAHDEIVDEVKSWF